MYTFYAKDGDQWSGFVWHDTTQYDAGQWFYSGSGSSEGFYQITSEIPQGYDLSSFHGAAYNEGTTYTSSYYDSASGTAYTPYRYSLGLADGFSGPGSEYDVVWNGAEYDDFGYGGLFQASSWNSPDSLYYWTFYATTGDQWSGYTFDDSVDHSPGEVWNSNFGSSGGTSYFGYYQITSEFAFGYDLSSAGGAAYNEGTTYTYSYYDSASGISYTPYNYSLGLADGYGGVGSEYDYVAKLGSWNDFGYGGLFQA